MAIPSTDMARPSAVHESVIDEQAIGVLRLPFDANPPMHEIPRYLALVRDAGKPWRCLMPQLFDWPYASGIIQTVCEHRAVLTVDGELRVARRRVTPEAYLRRWRRAIGDAGDITFWRTLDSVRPVSRFDLDTPVLRSAAARRTDCEFRDLPELLNAIIDSGTGVLCRGTPAEPSSESAPIALRLSIDLTKRDGARHAWWAQHLLCSVPQATSRCWSRSTIEMSRLENSNCFEAQGVTQAAQRALLHGALHPASTSAPTSMPAVV